MQRLAGALALALISAVPAAAETLTAHQAAERIGKYFTLSAMAAAVAAECANVPAGTTATKTGMTLAWSGQRDYRDAAEQAARYASAQTRLLEKLVAVNPSAGPELETGMAQLGGRAGMKYAIDSNALPVSRDTVVTR